VRILQICKKIPFPTTDGETVAIWDMTCAALAKNAKIHLICLQTDKQPNINEISFRHENFSYTLLKHQTKIVWMQLFFYDFFSKTPYIAQRFMKKNLIPVIKNKISDFKPDVVHIESLYMAWLMPHFSGVKKIVRTHNIEADIWQSRANKEKNLFKKIYFSFLSKKLRKYEINTLKHADSIICISNKEKEYFAENIEHSEVISLPTSIKILPPKAAPDSENYLFFGALDWFPNIDALNWLIKMVWPLILDKQHKAKLHIGGKNAAKRNIDFWKSIPNVYFHGEIENIETFYKNGSIMLVPLFSGSGIRIKIIEALSMRKAIVASPMAIDGLQLTHNEHLYVADSAHEFADAAIRLSDNNNLKAKFAENGIKYLERHHAPENIAEQLHNHYNKLINND